MKMKPFNLNRALAGHQVVTRDGTKVSEIFFFNTLLGQSPLVAVIHGRITCFSEHGHYHSDHSQSDMDLFMQTNKKEVYIAIYQKEHDRYATSSGFDSIDALEASLSHDKQFHIVKVEVDL